VAGIAALTAVIAGMAELLAGGKKPAAGSTPWIILRIIIDATMGMLAYPIVAAAMPRQWGAGLAAVFAGLTGAAVLRTTISIDSGRGKKVLSPEHAYRRLQEQINYKIDTLGAAAHSGWVTDYLLPSLQSMPFEEFAFRTQVYLMVIDKANPRKPAKGQQFIRELLDSKDNNSNKTMELLNYLIAAGHHDFLRSLVKPRKRFNIAINPRR
jgi:hypothetical protein